MAWNDGISGPHLSVAASNHPRIGVLAGPGTGKTSFGLMRRVARLLEEGTPAERILLLSFTRVAAADLRDKVATLDGAGAENVRATTLHGYCFGLLQRQAVLAITGRIPRILLEHEVDLMLRDLGDGFGNIHERRRRLEAFTAGWARNIEDYPGIADTFADRDFEQRTMSWLHLHDAMLIGEVVPLAFDFLRNNPTSEERSAFEHIVVDEYQDLNTLEQSLLDTLAEGSSLCIAGDDDQSIYSVRYANPEGILTFLDRDDVESHSIEVCGRCPEVVLAMANALIAQAPGREKVPMTVRDSSESGNAAIIQWPDLEAEIDGIASAIAADVAQGIREPGDILVLTNWRKIGERVRARLESVGVPVRSFFTEEEVKGDDARRALALLRLVVKPDDAPALRVMLGLADSDGRSVAYQRVLGYAQNQGTTPSAVLARLASGERLGLSVRALVDRYGQAMTAADHLRALSLESLVDELFPPDHEPVADLRALALATSSETADAASLLQALLEAITQDTVPQSPDFVRVMSLHKSKGLTSPSVYVVGAVNGVLPTVVGDSHEQREAAIREGRRLFYVAVTRASAELVISSAATIDLADASARQIHYERSTMRHVAGGRHTVRTLPSPYLREFGRAAPRAQTGEAWLRGRG